MEITFQDKLDNQEINQIEQALLLLDSRAKMQRLKIARQESALKREQQIRENLREQVIKLSSEFSDLLGSDHFQYSSNENTLMCDTISILERYMGHQMAGLKESDNRVSYEKGELQQDLHKASSLDLTNQELEKIVRRAIRLNQSGKEQSEIDEITERPTPVKLAYLIEEATNNRIIFRDSHLIDSAQPQVIESTYSQNALEPLETQPCSNLTSSSHSLGELGDDIDNEGDLYNQISQYEDRLLGYRMDTYKASLMQNQPGQPYLEASSKKPSLEPAQETVAEPPDYEYAQMNSSKIEDPLSLTVSLPFESGQCSKAPIEDEKNGNPQRINWKESFLTISISEREGMAKIDLSADRALRDTLSNARRYFESELKQLFKLDVEINEIYQNI